LRERLRERWERVGERLARWAMVVRGLEGGIGAGQGIRERKRERGR